MPVLRTFLQRVFAWFQLGGAGTGSEVAAATAPVRRMAAATTVQTPVAMVLNQPVTTPGPQLVVAGMQPSLYTFELVVHDDAGGASNPVTCQVTVQPPIIQ
jgi:hypothetical protein